MKILLVDDEPNVLRALERELRPLGHMVKTAQNGQEALDRIRSAPPDVLITDIRMPVMDGFELLRAISDEHVDLVRIVLTGYADLAHATEVVREGLVDHFLTKPWEHEQILECLQDGIRTRQRSLALTPPMGNTKLKLVGNS